MPDDIFLFTDDDSWGDTADDRWGPPFNVVPTDISCSTSIENADVGYIRGINPDDISIPTTVGNAPVYSGWSEKDKGSSDSAL